MTPIKIKAWDTLDKKWYTGTSEFIWTNSETFEIKQLEGLIYCLFTGKMDKNGTEIYEGDCLRWYPNRPKNHIGVVVSWDDFTSSFYFGDWYDGDFPDTKIDSLVIGNVFEKQHPL